MKTFKHINAKTIEEASTTLKDYKGSAAIIAGGTDLLGTLKDDIQPIYPNAIVNIKNIQNLEYIKLENGVLKIGALTTLQQISTDATVLSKFNLLAEAAKSVGTFALRSMGTIGGNICQETRCWYYRSSGNYFNCLRKDSSGLCYALTGDTRYHSIFGATNGCIAVNPSDVAPALVALKATIITSKRQVPIDDFFDVRVAPNGVGNTILDNDEIVTEIQIPEFSGKGVFIKFAIRETIDFPIVNCAAVIGGGKASICLNAVAGTPKRLATVEEAIANKEITEETASAAVGALKGTLVVGNNKYKIQIAKTLVKRAILACK